MMNQKMRRETMMSQKMRTETMMSQMTRKTVSQRIKTKIKLKLCQIKKQKLRSITMQFELKHWIKKTQI